MGKRQTRTALKGRNKKRRKRREPSVVAEQAAVYGFKAPAELPPGERYISPNQAGRILNITGEAVKQWIYHRRLPAIKLSNGYWKIKVSDLEQFMQMRQDLTQRRIMVIDNAGAQLDELSSAIEKLGHQAVVAHNATDALLKAADLYPSLFIVNVSATAADAWKLIAKIRKSRNIKTLPIMIVSDHDLKEGDSEKAQNLTLQGFLKRPMKAQAIAQEIQKVLDRIM